MLSFSDLYICINSTSTRIEKEAVLEKRISPFFSFWHDTIEQNFIANIKIGYTTQMPTRNYESKMLLEHSFQTELHSFKLSKHALILTKRQVGILYVLFWISYFLLNEFTKVRSAYYVPTAWPPGAKGISVNLKLTALTLHAKWKTNICWKVMNNMLLF